MVSVIVPVYGVEQYIERCARSLFEQTFQDIEFVFVNDCTKDNSMSVLKDVIREYPDRNVIIVNNDVNMGSQQTRVKGFEHASGDYILFVDSDDWIDPDMVELLYNKIVDSESDMAICNWFEEYLDHSERYELQASALDEYYSSILSFRTDAYLWNRMFCRHLIDDSFVFPKYNLLEDYATTTQLLERCKKISFIPDCLYHYSRTNLTSITNAEHIPEKSKDTLFGKLNNLLAVYNLGVRSNAYEKNKDAYVNLGYCIIWECMRHSLAGRFKYCELRNAVRQTLTSKISKHFQLDVRKQLAAKLFAPFVPVVCGFHN